MGNLDEKLRDLFYEFWYCAAIAAYNHALSNREYMMRSRGISTDDAKRLSYIESTARSDMIYCKYKLGCEMHLTEKDVLDNKLGVDLFLDDEHYQEWRSNWYA